MIMVKCGKKTEVYSRVCGFYRPVASWNRGKKEEFRERRNFSLAKPQKTRVNPGNK